MRGIKSLVEAFAVVQVVERESLGLSGRWGIAAGVIVSE